MVPGNATPRKDDTSSASEDRSGTILVYVEVTYAGGQGDLASAISALATAGTVFTVTVTPGENVKVSFANAAGAYAATPGNSTGTAGTATFTFTGSDLSAGTNEYHTADHTLHIAVHGGTSSANGGVTGTVNNLSISAQVSGGTIQ